VLRALYIETGLWRKTRHLGLFALVLVSLCKLILQNDESWFHFHVASMVMFFLIADSRTSLSLTLCNETRKKC
jgi:steroid 5-alpha reductase family enzyme